MTEVLYAAVPAVILFFQGIGFKIYALKTPEQFKGGDYVFNTLNLFVCFLITLPFAFVSQALDVKSLIFGLFHGVVFAGMILFYNKAMNVGKIAFNNFVMALSMLIPILIGAVILKETISVMQWIGLAVFFAASYLVCFGQKTDGRPTPKKAYVYIAIAAVCSGTVSLLIKYFYRIYPEVKQLQQMDCAFLTASLVMLAAFGVSNRFLISKKIFADKWFFICLAIVATATAFGNITFNLFSVKVTGALFYPIANGLPMILAVLVSPFFKEKITVRSAVGMALGVGAVVLLNL